MLVKKPRFLIILVCNNSCCLYKTILVCTLFLVAHNGFAFDFPILLAEVERRPEWTCSIFEPGMSTSVTPSLCCGRYIYKINDLLEFFYFYLDEEGWGRHSPGDITWDGETPFENSWECHRRHVANTNTKQQSYTIE